MTGMSTAFRCLKTARYRSCVWLCLQYTYPLTSCCTLTILVNIRFEVPQLKNVGVKGVVLQVLVQLGLYLQFYMPIALFSIGLPREDLVSIAIRMSSHMFVPLLLMQIRSVLARDLLLSLLHEVSVPVLASVRSHSASHSIWMSILYKALLLLALRVDGRSGLLGLLGAGRGEVGADEGGAEGCYCELLSTCQPLSIFHPSNEKSQFLFLVVPLSMRNVRRS